MNTAYQTVSSGIPSVAMKAMHFYEACGLILQGESAKKGTVNIMPCIFLEPIYTYLIFQGTNETHVRMAPSSGEYIYKSKLSWGRKEMPV